MKKAELTDEPLCLLLIEHYSVEIYLVVYGHNTTEFLFKEVVDSVRVNEVEA